MRRAYSQASSTISDFVGLVKSDVSAIYMAKLRFRDPDLSDKLGEDRFFYLWLCDVYYHEDEKMLSGEFFEVPEGFSKWHQVGTRLAFDPEDVFDWMVIENGHARVLLQFVSQEVDWPHRQKSPNMTSTLAFHHSIQFDPGS